MVNGMKTVLPTSPIFSLPKASALTGTNRNARENEAVANAVAALASGKYRKMIGGGAEV